MRHTRRFLLAGVAVFSLALASAVPAAPPKEGLWFIFAHTPNCYGPVHMLAECQGDGLFISYSAARMLNQEVSCSVMYTHQHWSRIGCYRYPTNPRLSVMNGGEAPTFQINRCGYWYSTEAIGRLRVYGAWHMQTEVAPAIRVRCS